MSKFNVGDKVRRTGEDCNDIVHGGIYTVERIRNRCAIVLCESASTRGYDLDLFEAAPSGNTTNTTKESLMHKFNVGDTVKRTSSYPHGIVELGGEYVVSNVRADGALQLAGDVVHHYDEANFELVVPTGTLTDKEVFLAIVDGKSLQYRLGGSSNWYNLKYPEKLTLLDVQRGTYRVRPTGVKLECTVPYPEYTIGSVPRNSVRKYSVDFGTGKIRDFGEAELPLGGVFWSSREQAEQFRDTVLASLQGK